MLQILYWIIFVLCCLLHLLLSHILLLPFIFLTFLISSLYFLLYVNMYQLFFRYLLILSSFLRCILRYFFFFIFLKFLSLDHPGLFHIFFCIFIFSFWISESHCYFPFAISGLIIFSFNLSYASWLHLIDVLYYA